MNEVLLTQSLVEPVQICTHTGRGARGHGEARQLYTLFSDYTPNYTPLKSRHSSIIFYKVYSGV